MVNGLLQAVVSAWESPKTRQKRPEVTRASPGMSSGSWSVARSFFSHRMAPVAAMAAKARLTKSVQRHDA